MLLLSQSTLAGTRSRQKGQEGQKDQERWQVSFREGFDALTQGQWKTAFEKMGEALKSKPNEEATLVRIRGMEFRTYLPHYYRGWAVYSKFYINERRNGEVRAVARGCEEAREEWQLSVSDRVIVRSQVPENKGFADQPQKCLKTFNAHEDPSKADRLIWEQNAEAVGPLPPFSE
jgi:hypothetical protein